MAKTLLFLLFVVFSQVSWAQTTTSSVRLNFVSVTASENTGQIYDSWLTDDLTKLVPSSFQSINLKWVKVTLKLQQKSLVSSLSLYDFEGSFADKPALLYAMNGTEQTLIGSFDGSKFKVWVPLRPAQPLIADAIMIYKYGNNFPQKIQAFGNPILEDLLTLSSVGDNPVTGMDYSAYLNDQLSNLVPAFWSPDNSKWTKVSVRFYKKSLVTRLELYDYEGSFTDKPAQVYIANGTDTTLIGTFTGESYMEFISYNLPTPLPAEDIVIRKYGNNIPVKIRAYGTELAGNPLPPIVTTPPASTTTSPVSSTTAVVVDLGTKIPIDGTRWYTVNNIPIDHPGLFDGNIVDDLLIGWGKILNTYDAYYPLKPGELMSIKAIKFYAAGYFTNTASPMRLSIIDSNWKRTELGQFQGATSKGWVGPYPARGITDDTQFLLDNIVTGARYLVINTTDMYPREIELYGTYTPSTVVATPPPKKSPKLKNLLGINAFEWDFYDALKPAVLAPKADLLRSFGVIRHYLDWEKLELTEGNFTYNPTHLGSWNLDLMYERCKADGIEVMTCIKTLPSWMIASYPTGMQDSENVPARYRNDPSYLYLSTPASYIEQARMAFQYAARYGNNKTIDPALVKVNTATRWKADPANVVKIGLGLVKYIECENERDKWWKGRNAYQTGREYAANMSAFYDGHKNTMGPGVGVKNADPAMVVVMGGLSALHSGTDYIQGMIDWCKQFRGYKADGRVDLCWDVINYHLYSDNTNSSQTSSGPLSRGAAPEVSVAAKVARNVLKLAHDACYDMPVYISEAGFDLNQGSPLRAIAIGSKSVLATQADWNLRTALMYAREGIDRIDFFQTYDLNLASATQFGSMGFLNSNFTRKLTADYFFQTKKLLGDYVFKESISTNPNVDRYEFNGQSAYALWIPDETGRTGQYTLNLAGATKAKVYTPQASRDTMASRVVTLASNKVTLTLTETPTFVIPVSGAGRLAADIPEVNGLESLRVYPNPSVDKVTVKLNNEYVGDVTISVFDANLGISRHTTTLEKNTTAFSGTIDLSTLPFGLYLLEVKQGNERTVRRIIRMQ